MWATSAVLALWLTGCSGAQKPEYPDTPGFKGHDMIVEESIELPDGARIEYRVYLGDDGGASFDTQFFDSRGVFIEQVYLDVERDKDVTFHGVALELCDIWTAPMDITRPWAGRDHYVYYAYSVDGTAPVCPEALR